MPLTQANTKDSDDHGRSALAAGGLTRTEAMARFERTGLPHRRLEGWRWSDFRQEPRGALAHEAGAEPADPFEGYSGALLTLSAQGWALAEGEQGGLIAVGRPDVAPEEIDGPLALLAFASSSGPQDMAFELAGTGGPAVRIRVNGEANLRRDGVLRLRIPAGAKAQIFESYLVRDGFTNTVVEIDIAEGAEVTRTVFLAGGVQARIASAAIVRLSASSRFEQTALSLGAGAARLETRLRHCGAGSHAVLNGAYLLSEGAHSDMTTHVRHSTTHATSRQRVKGVCRAGGRGVFQGKYLIDRGAQGSDAEMRHDGLLLAEGAQINTKPELEIYADDVSCSHGAATGAIDPALLFYMRQRGVPESEAMSLVVRSFLAQAFENCDELVSQLLLDAAAVRLGTLT